MTHAESRARELQVIELCKQGYSLKQCAEMFGLTQARISSICSKHGLDIIKIKHDQYREYKMQGHTNREVAEHFGVSFETVKKICRGINPQHGKTNQHTKTTEEEKRAYVESFLPQDFSYVDGYIDCDHKVTIRCKRCGHVFERSMVAIRKHQNPVCPNCIELDNKANEEADRILMEEQNAKAEMNRAIKKWEAAKEKASRIHLCPVCGRKTTSKKYCSDYCMHKANDHRKEINRRAKLTNALVDSDIEIHELYKRDKGVCHICGGLCDWNDKEYTPLGIFCGNNYPSIDHVIPLAKGGLHEWNNVRLAHRLCNSIKRDNIAPLG